MAACSACGLVMPFDEIDTHDCRDPWDIVEELETKLDAYRNAIDEIATGPWGETEMRNIAREAIKKGDSHETR